jgi:acyl-CoA thioester hydrolase
VSELSGRIEKGMHCMPIRVYFEDTDSGGIVYYANYLRFAERARTEMLRLSGINQTEMANRYGMAFAVRDCTIDFRYPARLDDLIEVRSRIVELAGARVSAVQALWCGTEELVRIEVRVACLRGDGRPTRIPALLRRAFEPYLQPREQG